ncbi:uncharacterized protein LOC135265320 [Tribolium castaneum]|uniref:Nucleolus and neural progenitor protein-like N-terminal domain-containing protein n=1 Tax=Tribolium castaneum TaxID=7070 RepID=D6X0R9_TRICA|nr:hypothetical protein TcasGA2_TC012805 [Tribolium castaneum]
MDLWNAKYLKPPPIINCKISTKEIDIRLLKITLTDAVAFFDNQQHLCTEAALLSRTVYRLKMKFRSSKDFKAVEKLSRVLRTYLQMQFSTTLKYVLDLIPPNYKVLKTFFLTKNMIDFLLVRLQGLGKTLCRVLDTCKVISELTLQRFRLGHFWKIAAIVYAITARIFVITRGIFKFVCELYGNLLPFSGMLANAGGQWLPDGYVFPPKLKDWLGVDWLNLEDNVIEIPDDEPSVAFFKLLDDSDDEVEFCDEYIVVNDEPSVQEVKDSDVELCEDNVSKEEESDNEVDVGELVIVCDNKDKAQIHDDVDVGDLVIVCDNSKNGTKGRKRPLEKRENSSVIVLNDSVSEPKRKKRKRKRKNQINN